jgi:hypothetical protein
MAIIANWQNWARIALIVLIGSIVLKYAMEYVNKGNTEYE